MKQVISIATKLLWREFKNGELNLLALALFIAVTSMSSVALITDRVSNTLLLQAGDLIAADMLVSSAEPTPENWLQEASKRNVQQTRTAQFPSMVFHKSLSQLVAVKAVAENYPLRGELKTDSKPYTEGELTTSIPEPGQVWVDSRLFNALQLSIGQSLEVGTAALTVTRILSFEPDFGGDMFSAAPRLMMNLDDLESTGLIVPGSRVRYKALFSAEQTVKLNDYRNWLKGNLRPTDSIQGIKDARPGLKVALDRADRFLGLSALVAVMLASIAIAMASSRYARRHQNSSAIMRTFGALQSSILNIFSIQLALLGLVASLLGIFAGYIVHEFVIEYFSQFIDRDLPDADMTAMLPAFSAGLLLIFSFSLPALYRLKNVSPIQVIQGRATTQAGQQLLLYIPALLSIIFLVIWQARDIKLAMIYLAGLISTVVILALATLLLLWLSNKLKSSLSVSWRISLTYLTRRKVNTMIESAGFGVGMMVIVILVLIRTDLIDDWLVSLPENTPNQFLINIQPNQVEQLTSILKEQSSGEATFYPMVRGRLTHINDEEVTKDRYEDLQTQRQATRLFNLSWASRLPEGNKVIAGQWWENATSTKQFSFDEEFAQRLGIKLGDKLTFYLSGVSVTAPVTSFREINWESFQPNFFVMASNVTLEDIPGTYIGSFFLPGNNKDMLTKLVRQFPNITVIDVQLMISQVRDIMNKVIQVIEAVFIFTLVAGILVMIATLQSTQDERVRDNAIMKTLGANKKQLRKILLTEFFLVGAISSLVATVAANIMGYAIANNLMNMPYQVHTGTFVSSIMVGTILITLTGLIAFWRYHKSPPMNTLRQATL